MATARLVPALVQLRAQINALYPKRDKASDGWVGDTAHAARVSDHNPDSNGWVHALDVDRDGIDPYGLVETAVDDNRVNYVIFERTIWSRTYAFRARRYTGSNPHTAHVHISVLHGGPAGDGRAWALPGAPALPAPAVQLQAGVTSPSPAPSVNDLLDLGASGSVVLAWQQELWRVGIGVGQHDGIYGPGTAAGTRLLQEAAGIGVDGIVGPASRAAARQCPPYPKPDGAIGPDEFPYAGPGGPVETVRAFQARLVARGWRLDQDGIHGPRTRECIARFQQQVGLTADGVGGPSTWVALWTRPIT